MAVKGVMPHAEDRSCRSIAPNERKKDVDTVQGGIMRLGLISPTFPFERRVALIPQDIAQPPNELVVESGFGQMLGIGDEEYKARGCQIASRAEVFSSCDAIFSLKLLQPSDYEYLRCGQLVIGWTHPSGSGADFMVRQAVPKQLTIVDLDNMYPAIYHLGQRIPIPHIPRNFIWRNSFLAGFTATQHALLSYGLVPDASTRVAVLAAGNVSQGAYSAVCRYGCDLRLFYRKTMDEFYQSLPSFDIVINGIEMECDGEHVLTRSHLAELRPGTLVIDAAADADRAIQGTRYTTIGNPIYEDQGIYFYVVNNAPSIVYRTASIYISSVMSRYVFSRDVAVFARMISSDVDATHRQCHHA